MTRRLTLLAVLALVPFGTAEAQNVSRAGTTSAAFLGIGVGPRAQAMGGAFTALADDATALYWNPAGLASMQTGQVVSAHSEWLADINHDFVGVAIPALGGTVGASVTLLGAPEQIVRTELNQEGTGETFTAADLAIGLSYGRAITDRFSIGGTAKMVQQRIWNSSATGFAFDVGTQFRTGFWGDLVVGATVSNFGSDLKLDGRDLRTTVDEQPGQNGNNGEIPADLALDAWAMPLDFSIGVMAQPIRSRMNTLTLAVDALHPSNNYESLNAGVEYGYRDRIFLRGGVQGMFLDENEGGFSAGLGVRQPLPYPNGAALLDVGVRDVGRLGRVTNVALSVSF